MRRGWLSFADHSRPEGEHLIGVCVVEVTEEDIETAREKITRLWPGREHDEVAIFCGACLYVSYRDGCNPGRDGSGCEVVVLEMPDWAWDEMKDEVTPSRMFTQEQLAKYGVRRSDDDETTP